MVPQPLSRLPAPPQWSISSTGARAVAPGVHSVRDAWVAAFARRFLELRPLEEAETVRALAVELWDDVGGHDPAIAAEMEHEASFGD